MVSLGTSLVSLGAHCNQQMQTQVGHVPFLFGAHFGSHLGTHFLFGAHFGSHLGTHFLFGAHFGSRLGTHFLFGALFGVPFGDPFALGPIGGPLGPGWGERAAPGG